MLTTLKQLKQLKRREGGCLIDLMRASTIAQSYCEPEAAMQVIARAGALGTWRMPLSLAQLRARRSRRGAHVAHPRPGHRNKGATRPPTWAWTASIVSPSSISYCAQTSPPSASRRHRPYARLGATESAQRITIRS